MALSALSVAVLAGGMSKRMAGSDKAFLQYEGRPFVGIITNEMLKVSEEVFVVIGKKARADFESSVDARVRVVPDEFHLGSPMGGMLSALSHNSCPYVAFLACDMPLAKSEVIRYLYGQAQGHSAAIPTWGKGSKGCEPLCAVYKTDDAKTAGMDCLRGNEIACKNLISRLRDANYVEVSKLRHFDPDLVSLMNINSKKDLEAIARF